VAIAPQATLGSASDEYLKKEKLFYFNIEAFNYDLLLKMLYLEPVVVMIRLLI